METSLLTVVVTAFNASSTIEKMITSLLNQECEFSYDVLVVDDGSSDDTFNKVKQFKSIKALKKKNTGVSDTRNYALNHLDSRFVTFVDSDDYVEKDYLATLMKPFRKYKNVDLSICGYFKEDESGKVILKGVSNKEILSQKQVLRDIFISASFEGFLWNKLFKTSIIKNNNLKFRDDVTLAEDLLFCCEYSNYIKEAYVNFNPVYHYVMQTDSALNSTLKVGTNYTPSSLNILYSYEQINKVIPDDYDVRQNFESQRLWNCISILRMIYSSSNQKEVPNNVIIKLRNMVKQGRGIFLRSEIFPFRDKVIYIFVMLFPKLFSFLWKNLKLKGQGN